MKYAPIALLIAIALVARLLPHPDNFTPVLAVALFAGATLPGALAVGVPLAAMLGSDLLMGEALTWTSAVVYGCFAAATLLGRWLGTKRTGTRSWTKTAGAALAGSLFFFVVTNFAVWLGLHALYPRTWEGLVECYAMAIPFFRNALAGDLFWTLALFGLYEVAVPSRHVEGGRTAG
jgi:hypothetical protein